MALISGQVPSLVGGVSQQGPTVRSQSQCEYVENGWLHPALGHGKRPGAELVATLLSAGIPASAFFHPIVRDSAERYLVVVGDGTVRVFDHETGQQYTTVYSAGSLAYLAGATHENTRAVTIADSTFIVNTAKTVQMDAATSPGSLTASVQLFSDLPKTATAGQLYGIKGDPATGFDGYYVQRESAGVWREIAKPGIPHAIDATTMPHELKRIPDAGNPDGFYFAFGPADWDVRPAGDEVSAPPPSFVGERIKDIILHRERLGLITRETVVLSEVGYYFNFWRTTVTQLLDSDPIDITITQNGVLDLSFAVPYQSSLMLHGQDIQVQLTGEPYLSPKTCKADVISTYSSSPTVRPILVGDSLHYASGTELNAVIREYFADDVSVTGDAEDVTAHVPTYVPANIRCMAGATAKDVLFIAAGSAIYLYQFKWTNAKEKLQAAWHRWAVVNTGPVLFMNTIGDILYLVCQNGTAVELLRINLSENARHPLVPTVPIHLDRSEVITGVYNAMGGYTDFIPQSVIGSLDGARFIQTTDGLHPGAYAQDFLGATLVNGGMTIRVPGNLHGKRYLFGFDFNHRIGLSEVQVRDANGLSIIIGRLQVRRMTVAYTAGAYFETVVQPKGRDPMAESYNIVRQGHYNARTVGDADFALGAPTLGQGIHKFLVMSRSDQVDVAIENPLPYPCWFQSVQWEASYTARSKA